MGIKPRKSKSLHPKNRNKQPNKKSRSVGILYDNDNKTSDRSPALIGTLPLQRRTFEAIVKEFEQLGNDEEALCNIAAWDYSRAKRRIFYVQISPPYRPKPKLYRTICKYDE